MQALTLLRCVLRSPNVKIPQVVQSFVPHHRLQDAIAQHHRPLSTRKNKDQFDEDPVTGNETFEETLFSRGRKVH